ncbi:hypothetical protein BC826DRAFT_1030064 [Russula brevipes]|nr:hypothetical protein BC826DRAFT_1030064 [Russula brevipes]
MTGGTSWPFAVQREKVCICTSTSNPLRAPANPVIPRSTREWRVTQMETRHNRNRTLTILTPRSRYVFPRTPRRQAHATSAPNKGHRDEAGKADSNAVSCHPRALQIAWHPSQSAGRKVIIADAAGGMRRNCLRRGVQRRAGRWPHPDGGDI